MLKKLFPWLIAFLIAFSPILVEAKSYKSIYGKGSLHSGRSVYKSYGSSHHVSSHKDNTYASKKSSLPQKSTYKIGNTKYSGNERYKSSGLPKVERSELAKREFLKSKGYKQVPPGYEVDHVIPLSKGGQDEPSNMQLIPKGAHKQKTASERKR